MIELSGSRFSDILPEHLAQQDEVQALAFAVGRQVEKLCIFADGARTYAAIHVMPEEILDLLAVELRTPAYDEAYPIHVKRGLIEGSLLFYSKMGTPAALNQIIKAIFETGKIVEWFDYKGEPYHFKIAIEIGDEVVKIERSRQVLQRIQYYKNLRSVLDEVSYLVKPLPIPNPPPVLWLRHLLLHLRFFSYGGSEYLFLNGRKLLDGTWLLNQMLRGVNFRQVVFCMPLLESERLVGVDVAPGALRLTNHFSGLALALAAFWIRLPNSFDLSFVRLNGQRLLDGSWLLDQEVHGIHFPSFALRATLSEGERLAEQMHFVLEPLALRNDTEGFHVERTAFLLPFPNYLGLSFVWLNGQRLLDGSWLLDQDIHGIYFPNLTMRATLSEGERLAKQMHLALSQLTLRNTGNFRLDRTAFGLHFASCFARGVAFHVLELATVLQNVERLALQQKATLTVRTTPHVKVDTLSLQGKLSEQTRIQAARFALGTWRVQTASKLSNGTITQDSMWHLDGKRSCDGRYKLNADIIKETI